MAWIQINTTVSEALAEPLSDAFMEVNAASVTFADAKDQPIFEPEIGTTPIWSQTKVIGLFDAEADIPAVINQLATLIPDVPAERYNIEALEDKDWIRAWMDQFQPMQFGSRLWIVPSWCDTPDPKAVNLMLDPGMAFGTGTHPTTALCLTWLDQNPPTDLTVIDYGCGSGVLALAAEKLGAKHVKGTDIDPQAIIASQQNADRNNANIEFKLVKEFQSEPVDLLIANILAGPLKALAPEFIRLMKPNATLILSGLLTNQAADLIAFYQQQGFEFLAQNDLDEWSQLSFTKQVTS
ncbi:MAG: 50S ribosomal protein L11 methyltransferase [Hydrogenovibrio crunogenus]|uniref:Ribosomal protein L11 methyltransferase n=1 Tax=Hydrogenovibrio crunogenus (strain DSM 25203 / XCL-2) TaxID=317025 RepID=PRMA_HYDCU|nr:RecName: Full=Ribosomal protein L11 methyltransferase; Short=L11 Mtase [Hydrogenovibrio crunogenus XCL-2]MBD3611661.1 50S ribosomal protein L11 methyltransferase [Hydrogenovibrio crunogenus]